MEKYTLDVDVRDIKGTANSRRLRNEGLVPGIVYGKKQEPVMLQFPSNEFEKLYRKAGESSLIELTDGKSKWNVVIVDVDIHPFKPIINHVDFQAVVMDEVITVPVQLKFVGTAPGVKDHGGTFVQNLDEVEVTCLPADMLHDIEVDVSLLTDIGSLIHVSDLNVPSNVKIENDPEDVIASIAAPIDESDLETNTEQEIPEGAESDENEEGGGESEKTTKEE